ncbi:hypothetical protein GUITHDRAFT_164770 [Guillardia theta CCMP2712]|uniref:Uncharacterized protein n=1 Tax=Guillardia theta (strain CCMP2712) TaxID=905079 RepID=L1IW58_GUITC|nr:hypothetical protein GUITHDRAFT_164770 [Guillardia theta CCMP2712]EKX40080.1 hypothetical protein GUITHDRAFT_164770 [Guillardia theta CCMP2712]|eukprot:XP_005827060.1 hypothetical protein GUITHDRAFT_164770 [Guillardia theta CCMP2712]
MRGPCITLAASGICVLLVLVCILSGEQSDKSDNPNLTYELLTSLGAKETTLASNNLTSSDDYAALIQAIKNLVAGKNKGNSTSDIKNAVQIIVDRKLEQAKEAMKKEKEAIEERERQAEQEKRKDVKSEQEAAVIGSIIGKAFAQQSQIDETKSEDDAKKAEKFERAAKREQYRANRLRVAESINKRIMETSNKMSEVAKMAASAAADAKEIVEDEEYAAQDEDQRMIEEARAARRAKEAERKAADERRIAEKAADQSEISFRSTEGANDQSFQRVDSARRDAIASAEKDAEFRAQEDARRAEAAELQSELISKEFVAAEKEAKRQAKEAREQANIAMHAAKNSRLERKRMEEAGKEDIEAAKAETKRAQDIASSSEQSGDMEEELKDIEKDLHILQGKVQRDEEMRLSASRNDDLPRIGEERIPRTIIVNKLRKPKSMAIKSEMNAQVERELYRLISKIALDRTHKQDQRHKLTVYEDPKRFLVKKQPPVSSNPFDWIVRGLKPYESQVRLSHPSRMQRVKPYAYNMPHPVAVHSFPGVGMDALSPELQAHRALASAQEAIRRMGGVAEMDVDGEVQC